MLLHKGMQNNSVEDKRPRKMQREHGNTAKFVKKKTKEESQ
tara:strand:- start:892 stop:1014 length:123 start_codon:yes stop_codon:yes gene_type:complete